jgi:uncharacterized phage-associated protein
MHIDIYKYESNQMCDGWGFYVDIENASQNNLNHEIIREKYKIKNFKNYNKYKNYDNTIEYCEPIYEEYEYYCKNNLEDKEESELDYCCNKSNDGNEKTLDDKKIKNFIFKVSSTTVITVVLTYFIFVIL